MKQLAFEEPQPHRGTAKVALLIDGDNIPSDFAGQMLLRAARLGQVIFKRAYVDPHHVKNWEESAGFSLCLARSRRGAADLLLAIDAVDLANRGDLDAFVIASGDGGFAPLGRYLVERGLTVLGLGNSSAPADWRKSCTRFEVLAERSSPVRTCQPASFSSEEEPKPTTADAPPPLTMAVNPSLAPGLPASQPAHLIDATVVAFVREAGGAGVHLSNLGVRMREHGLEKEHLSERSWLKYLVARPHLYRIIGSAPGLSVALADPTRQG